MSSVWVRRVRVVTDHYGIGTTGPHVGNGPIGTEGGTGSKHEHGYCIGPLIWLDYGSTEHGWLVKHASGENCGAWVGRCRACHVCHGWPGVRVGWCRCD